MRVEWTVLHVSSAGAVAIQVIHGDPDRLYGAVVRCLETRSLYRVGSVGLGGGPDAYRTGRRAIGLEPLAGPVDLIEGMTLVGTEADA